MFADTGSINGRPVYEFCDLKILHGKSLNYEQVSVPCERRPTLKNRGGARSDRADTGRLPDENARRSQRSRAGSVMDM